MVIHTVGDSHSKDSFKDTSNARIHWLGPLTMRRVGYPEDHSIVPFPVAPGDVVLFCFGEIDVRCHVKNLMNFGRSMDTVLKDMMVDRYVAKLVSLRSVFPNARLAVMSVVPPAYRESCVDNKEVPFSGTDEERSSYTARLNELLKTACGLNGLEYLDSYSLYKDDKGMLPIDMMRNTHIGNTKKLNEHLVQLGWV